MKRALGLAVLLVVLVGLGSGPLRAQTATPRRPPGEVTPGQAPAVKTQAPGAPSRSRQDDKNAPVTVDADRLENLQKEGLILFTGNVVASQNNSTQYADRMEVYLDAKGDSIVRTVSTGNVRIVTRDCRTGTAQRVEYHDAEQRVILIGNARVWREDNLVTGDRITIYLAEDRSVVEGGKQERVKAIFYPKSQEQQKAEKKPAAGTPCS